jgi:16S rRNA (guanine1516-N2)-methyltransferase
VGWQLWQGKRSRVGTKISEMNAKIAPKIAPKIVLARDFEHSETLEGKLQNLALELNLPIVDVVDGFDCAFDFALTQTASRLELRKVGEKSGPVFVDFVEGKAAHRRKFGGGRGQEIARAVGIKGAEMVQVVDATAGMGQDAFVLASLGCHVTLLERNPIVAALLLDGLERAALDPVLAPILARMRLLKGDALELLPTLHPQVIYLDPMYPSRSKAAKPKKEMQFFHMLVGGDPDSVALLERALACQIQNQVKRVVVKRPQGSETLSSRVPGATVESKNTRFDLYF